MTDENKSDDVDNVIQMPSQVAEPEAMTAEKINAALADPKLQQLGAAIITANQLYAWAVMGIRQDTDHEEAVLQSLINGVCMSMIAEDGLPRPFRPLDMLNNLKEVMPFLETEIAAQIAADDAEGEVESDQVEEVEEGDTNNVG